MMNALLKLIEYGQSYWLDNLSRDMIENGELKKRVTKEGLRGVTSNPAIFEKAIAGSDAYDSQIASLTAQGRSIAEVYDSLTVKDVQDACDILRPVYDSSSGGDGFVSLEVSPYLAHDPDATMADARRLWAAVGRPNLFIKIPGTQAAVPAIEQMLSEGINVNITLLFSIESYEAVAQAHIRALERRVKDGKPVKDVASVASFFLSRIDVLVDQLLTHRKRRQPKAGEVQPESLTGKIAVANAKLAYQSFKRIFHGPRWEALVAKGARVQRPLWASTSTKNPAYRDVCYVEPLIGRDTVNTMPDVTIEAFGDHGVAQANSVEADLDQANAEMRDLARIGIDLARVTWQLENEGIQKFIDPFESLMKTLKKKADKLAAGAAAKPAASGGRQAVS
jgi:transaldolase